ncbi:MAG: type II secretion system minor pseudopilin GspJ [Alcanivoracaceae bacterium]|nr:type II secretion system minor pseudopilin GspJ [Alcanivoracaceae bacterium]
MQTDRLLIASPQRGFTLLEVLIAIAIFAGIFLAAQQMFSQAVQNRDRLELEAARMESQQLLLTWLTLDFEQIVARPVRDGLGTELPAVMSLDRGVALTRNGWANPFALRQRSELQRVEYFLNDDQELIRRYWPALDVNQGTVPVELVMIKDVEDFQVRYLSEANKGQYEWMTLWPAPAQSGLAPITQPLPKSIEVNIFLESGEVVHRFFRTVANPWH